MAAVARATRTRISSGTVDISKLESRIADLRRKWDASQHTIARLERQLNEVQISAPAGTSTLHQRQTNKGDGASDAARWRYANEFDAALSAQGFHTEASKRKCVYSKFARNLGSALNLVSELIVPDPRDKRQEIDLVSYIATSVTDALQQQMSVAVANAVESLSCRSRSAYKRLRTLVTLSLEDRVTKKGKTITEHVAKKIYVPELDITIQVPQWPGAKALKKEDENKARFLGLEESTDQLAVTADTDVALSEAIKLAEKEQAKMKGYVQDLERTREILMQGDAAHLFKGQDATTAQLTDITVPFAKTQAPQRGQEVLYMLGKDTHARLLQYGEPVFKGLRRVKGGGVLIKGEAVARAVKFRLAGDWKYQRDMLGLMNHPNSSCPCWVCTCPKELLHLRKEQLESAHIDTEGNGTPLAKTEIKHRDIKRMAHLAHMAPMGEDTFVPFTCPACDKNFPTEKSVEEHHAKASATARKNHPSKHESQMLGTAPLVGGWVDDILDCVCCLLHFLLSAVDAMFDKSIRDAVEGDENLRDRINEALVEHHVTLPRVKDPAKVVQAHLRKGGGGVIGAEAIRMCKVYEEFLSIAWSVTGFANQRERRKKHAEWAAVWEAFNDLWETLTFSDTEDNIQTAAYVKDVAEVWVKAFETASSSESVRIYMHIVQVHVPEWIERHGNLLRFVGEGIEAGNHDKKVIGHDRCNKRKHGNAREDGTHGRGVAYQILLRAFRIKDAHRAGYADNLSDVKRREKNRQKLLYERGEQRKKKQRTSP